MELLEDVKFYTLQDVARILGVTPKTVNNYASKGWLKTAKVGSYRITTLPDVKALIKHLEERNKPKKKGSTSIKTTLQK